MLSHILSSVPTVFIDAVINRCSSIVIYIICVSGM